ncbi:patatin-like phospholipase family protein [Alteromonas ponticola]|uniref:Patatin-like phospholipase family protein n=1 Tax=Alteromonas ponticola TaxID=2720613 RepID=A0ABX1R609_9ALTE|nr:patatin-like phospholipase family protein [Alteromonas ponticola]NMH60562.1 patatin-like phospholipase family protein [Alteromonas ponticola]
MGKVLKLGFAMGGGVSLGSFSGAALTESIKLALLYAKDTNGDEYKRIEIDVFSGASAGAMSLGIMLKGLAFPEHNAVKRMRAWEKLIGDYGFDADSISEVKKQQLIDTELTQQALTQIWVREISIYKLLKAAGSGKVPPLHSQAGIFNKAAITDIAKKFLSPPMGNYQDDHKATYPILAPRVLYSCSISNLSPLIANVQELYLEAPEGGAAGPDIAANDALSSKFHQEHRIFDINFNELDNDKFANDDIHPKRWMRFHWGKAVAGESFDIRSEENWKHIVATAIASGAFPIAFEPVPLIRYKWEFPKGLWNFHDSTQYLYSYVDGGVFANSPVSEAFKLASHIDATTHLNDEEIEEEFERRIIFVDPSIDNTVTFNLKGYKEYKDQKPIDWLGEISATTDGNDLLCLSSLDKLVPCAVSLLSAISSQASAHQSHQNFQIANKIKMRNDFRKLLQGQVTATEDKFLQLRFELQHLLRQFSNKALIPTLAADLAAEFERLAREPDSVFTSIRGKGEILAHGNWADIEPESLRNAGMHAMLCSFMDLIADLEAKSRNSQLISIGPVKIEQRDGIEISEKIFLPGSPLAGFAGFMSEAPSAYEVTVAKYCSFAKLKSAGLLSAHQPTPHANRYPGEFKDREGFALTYKAGLLLLADRIGKAIKSSNFVNLGWFNGPVLSALQSIIESMIKGLPYRNNTKDYEFRVEVNDKQFELDGKGWTDNDRHPVRLAKNNGKLYLICFAKRLWDVPETASAAEKWSGYFIEQGKLAVDRDSWGPLNDSDFVRIPLPSDALLKLADTIPNPVFYSKNALDKKQKPAAEALLNMWELKNDVVPYTELL